MPKVELSQIEQTNATSYPLPFAADVAGRRYRRVASAMGLTEIGASHVVLEPGAWSSQRHWHEGIDEMVIMLAGEAVLIEDDDETILRAGDIATFAKDVANGHHLINRSDRPCSFIAIDSRAGEGDCHYPDVDLHYDARSDRMTRKDGSAF
jgi:uncharacterized cupin superfamily protein